MTMIFKHVLRILAILISVMSGFAQNQSTLNCDSLYQKEKNESSLFVFYEKIAAPESGIEKFYQNVKDKFGSFEESGKVVVQFLVDTTGLVQCLRVISSDNDKFNDSVLNLIKNTHFTPAEAKGKKINSIKIMPIIFGKPSDKR